MFLPTIPDGTPSIIGTATAYTSFGDGSKSKREGWDSLIGVVTAICGNVLISFALNTQRYAHIRLSRDRDAREEEKRKLASGRSSPNKSYGTQQEDIAEERAVKNAKSELNGSLQSSKHTSETEPLIPRRTTSGRDDNTDHDDDTDENSPKEKSYLRSPIWWLGIALMVVGETGNFLAYGFAPASIVSPLGVVALISNCIIAPVFLGESFRWRDALGVIIAAAGAVVVVLSASSSNPKLTPDDIWDLVTTWEFETYLGITIFLIVALMILSNKYGHKSILIDIGLVGLFGGYTALSTKGVSSLLTYSIWRVVTFPITYLLVAVLVFTAVMQIKYINRALQHFNSTMVIPTQFVLFTISVIIGSAVLYRDFERENTEDAVKFVGGCALTFFGVWCITSGRKQDEDDEDGEAGDDEGAIDLVDEEGVTSEVRETDDGGTRQASFAASSSSTRRYHSATTQSIPRSSRAPGTESMTSFAPINTDVQPLMDEVAHLQPADASAIHITTTAQLSPEYAKDPQKKPILHATTSEPVVPTTPTASTSLRPKTPARTPSNQADMSHLTRTPSQPQYLDPNTPGRLVSRQSIVGLIPGPLMAPLSGSLSAIVADELRRGMERSPSGSMKRRRTPVAQRTPSHLSTSATAAGGSLKRHSIASIEFENDQAEDLRRAAGSPPSGRMRSLSATLSDMFSSRPSATRKSRQESAQGSGKTKTKDSTVDERGGEDTR